MNKSSVIFVAFLIGAVILTACAPGFPPPPATATPCGSSLFFVVGQEVGRVENRGANCPGFQEEPMPAPTTTPLPTQQAMIVEIAPVFSFNPEYSPQYSPSNSNSNSATYENNITVSNNTCCTASPTPKVVYIQVVATETPCPPTPECPC